MQGNYAGEPIQTWRGSRGQAPVGSHEWRIYRSKRNTFKVEAGTVLDGEMEETAVTGLEFADPEAAHYVWVKVEYDPQALTITSAVMQNGTEIPDDTDTVRHIEVARLINAYESTGGRWWSVVFQTRSEPIQMFAGGGVGPYHEWKVEYGPETDVNGLREWLVTGGTVYHRTGSTEVTDNAYNIAAGYIYLEVVRDETSRAVTGVTLAASATLPTSDYYTQYYPIAYVDQNAEPTKRVKQLQFSEIRVSELMPVVNGEFKLVTLAMMSRNFYDPPA